MKRVIGVLGGLVAVGLLAGGVMFGTDVLLVDNRPAGLGPDGSGDAMMRSIERAHGGLDAWMAVASVTVEMQGTWHSAVPRWRMAPFLDDPPHFRLTFRPAVHGDAVLEEVGTGRRFEVRGGRSIEHGAAGEQDGPWALPVFVDSMRHLVDLPFSMQSADVRRAVAGASGSDRPHHRVFATWGTAEPQGHLDQYVLWQAADSGRVAGFDTTGRFIAPFATAQVHIGAYLEAGGFTLPSAIDIFQGAGTDDPLMSWRVRSVSLSGPPTQAAR